MSRKAKRGLVERLRAGPVICAEGYVFELERRGYLQAGSFVPEVVLEHPGVVTQLHREFIRAGTDVVVALTYYGHREKMKLIGREDDLELLNRTALRLAKAEADANDLLLAGNICNTWAYKPDDSEAAQEVLRQYVEQVTWAAEEGADFILAETIEYVGEALLALEAIQQSGLPAVIHFNPIYEQTKDGYEWVEACKLLSDRGATVVGFNCARGPATILPLGRALKATVTGYTGLVPVPYYTTDAAPSFQFLKRRDGSSAYTTGLEEHLIDRQAAAEFARQAAAIGINFIGLCCGAGPQHIRALAEVLGRSPQASKYSADMSRHGLLGNEKVVKNHEKSYLALWK